MSDDVVLAETAALLVIGGEILSGKIRDENSFQLTRFLRGLGIELVVIEVQPDSRTKLADRLRALMAQADVVITSGGMGPTHDDVTMAAVADALSDRLERNLQLSQILSEIYGARLTEAHLLMAELPSKSELIVGKDVRWPLIKTGPIYSLPGVPELFRAKLSTLRSVLHGKRAYFGSELLFVVEEVELKDALDQVVARHPDVEIGSYPRLFDERYKTKITFDGRSEASVHEASRELASLLPEHLAVVRS